MTPPEADPVPFSEPQPVSEAVTIARIEGKIDRMLDRVTDLHSDSKDHETRLRAVETTYVTRSAVLAWLGILTALTTVAEVGVSMLIR